LKGDAPPTAALAVNLANVRLVRGEPAAAIEPARRALALAEKYGDASGVEIHAVRLLAGRAELPGGEKAAMDRLLQAVRDAQGMPGIQGDAYPAAVELAVAAHEARRYDVAREAWIMSARFARGSRISVEHALGRAKHGEAVARMAPLATAQFGARRKTELVEIDALLADAMDLVHDQAVQAAPGGDLTPAQIVFGEAGALKAAIPAKLDPDERKRWQGRESEQDDADIRLPGSTPRCEQEWKTQPKPSFPASKRVVGGVGSVVLKVLTDEAGVVTRVQVAGAAGGDEFAESVVSAVKQWRVSKADPAAAGCVLAGESFLAVTFVYST
jgi:TonB family protein